MMNTAAYTVYQIYRIYAVSEFNADSERLEGWYDHRPYILGMPRKSVCVMKLFGHFSSQHHC